MRIFARRFAAHIKQFMQRLNKHQFIRASKSCIARARLHKPERPAAAAAATVRAMNVAIKAAAMATQRKAIVRGERAREIEMVVRPYRKNAEKAMSSWQLTAREMSSAAWRLRLAYNEQSGDDARRNISGA